MELGTFAPRPRDEAAGDSFPAKEAVDKNLVVFVREHRTGIKTKFNQTPGEKGYKPDGGDGVLVDVADIGADEVYIDVLWMNGAVVDNLAPYTGQAVPIKLAWTPSTKGGNPYIGVQPLEGAALQAASAWAGANPIRFDTERAQRQTNVDAHVQPAATAPTTLPTIPQPAPAVVAPAVAQQPISPNDPAVAALLAQLQAQQAVS